MAELLDASVIDRLFGGRAEIYSRILSRFGQTGPASAVLIRKLFTDGDIDRFTIEVHGIKGAAANLGAMPLSDKAKELEMLGKAHDVDAIPAPLVEFESLFAQTMDAIKSMIAQIASSDERR